MEFEIFFDKIDAIELFGFLNSDQSISDNNILLKSEQINHQYRGAISDPAVLVAIVTGTSSVLVALITALIKFIRVKHSKKIVITGRNGTKIEVPADTSEKEIANFAKLALELEPKQIRIIE